MGPFFFPFKAKRGPGNLTQGQVSDSNMEEPTKPTGDSSVASDAGPRLKGTRGGGNTKPLPRKNIRSRAWVCTVFGYTAEDLTQMAHRLGTAGAEYILGEEKTAEGREHIQGWFRFKSQRTWSATKRFLPHPEKDHLERALGDRKANVAYCSKEGKYVTNIEIEEKPVVTLESTREEAIARMYTNVVWRPWQQAVLDQLGQRADTRKINWYVDEKGNAGKTFLAKYIQMKNPYRTIKCRGRGKDIFFKVRCILECKQRRSHDLICLIDVARAGIHKIDYETLEELKDGSVSSHKYESVDLMFPPPHVYVFANRRPASEMLSADRWNVIEL